MYGCAIVFGVMIGFRANHIVIEEFLGLQPLAIFFIGVMAMILKSLVETEIEIIDEEKR